jgi:hypothetical protein
MIFPAPGALLQRPLTTPQKPGLRRPRIYPVLVPRRSQCEGPQSPREFSWRNSRPKSSTRNRPRQPRQSTAASSRAWPRRPQPQARSVATIRPASRPAARAHARWRVGGRGHTHEYAERFGSERWRAWCSLPQRWSGPPAHPSAGSLAMAINEACAVIAGLPAREGIASPAE